MELAPQYLRDLPHDKDYHVFVCYESTTIDVVRILVENLESMGITCCYCDRDFPAGQSINVNITNAIKKSLHMVVVISENFQASDFCMYELDQALNLRMRGKYNLIPIKIEPCSIPECLQHIAYIDAEDDTDNAHKKIIDAMAKKEMQKSLRDVKNGESLKFKVVPYKPSRFSLTRYKLSFTEADKTMMWKNQFELPAELLDDIAHAANRSVLFKAYHILRDKIWQLSKQTYNQTGIIFYLFAFTVDTPELQISVNFMRYNIKPCKLYFMRRLDLDDDLKLIVTDTETKEECTDRCFDDFLRNHSKELENPSQEKRHRMANDAKCLCLLVEEWQKKQKI